MRLLIITQKVDSQDPILGFFVRWLKELSKNVESITVIAQYKGTYDLPANVHVHSLGKEEGRGVVGQILHCWKLIWNLRRDYDVALVHMTPIWVVLNGILWRLLDTPIFLWYESPGRRWPFHLSLFFVRKIFSATPLRLTHHEQKNAVINHGVDTDFWREEGVRDPHLVVTMGRVSQIKRVELIIECFASLPSHYRLMIIGGPFLNTDLPYYMKIEEMICSRQLYDRISMHFLNADHARRMLGQAQLFLHTSAGTLDKSLLQAMSCKTLVVSCCETSQSILPPACKATPQTFTNVVINLLQDTTHHQELRMQLRATIERHHSLTQLARRLTNEMSTVWNYWPVRLSMPLGFCLLLASCTSKVTG